MSPERHPQKRIHESIVRVLRTCSNTRKKNVCDELACSFLFAGSDLVRWKEGEEGEGGRVVVETEETCDGDFEGGV